MCDCVTKRNSLNKNKLFWKDPRDWIWILVEVTRWRGWRMIICKRPNDHLKEDGPSKWSFAIGWSFRMINCKRAVRPNDHLQEAGHSGWSFAKVKRGRRRNRRRRRRRNSVGRTDGHMGQLKIVQEVLKGQKGKPIAIQFGNVKQSKHSKWNG